MPNPEINKRVVLSGISLQAETQAWLAVLSSRPAPSVVNAVNNFIIQCKIDGNWTLLDRFWLFAQDNQTNARVSIVNPTATVITEVNSPTWTSLQGYTGNGTSMYLNTNYDPVANAVNFSLNSASFGSYSRTNSAAAQVDIGVRTTTNLSFHYSKFTDNKFYFYINNGTGDASAVVSDSLGLFASVRTASNAMAGYKNGSLVNSGIIASTAIPASGTFYVLALNNISLGTPTTHSARQISMAFTGGGGINQSLFYTAFQNKIAIPLGFNV